MQRFAPRQIPIQLIPDVSSRSRSERGASLVFRQIDVLSSSAGLQDATPPPPEDPRPPGCRKLSGKDKYRVRSGQYRIIYEIQDEALVVVIVRVAKRSEAYG